MGLYYLKLAISEHYCTIGGSIKSRLGPANFCEIFKKVPNCCTSQAINDVNLDDPFVCF